MTRANRKLIERIRDSKHVRIFIAASGAGAGIQKEIWSVPGCSAFLVGTAFPYATDAFDEFLGFKPDKYCSAQSAVDMAMEAFMRAGASEESIGIGVTGSVASLRAHRGPHQVFAASFSSKAVRVHAAVLAKGAGTSQRTKDGTAADQIGLNALFDAVDLPIQTNPKQVLEYDMSDEDQLARERFFAHPRFCPDGHRELEPSTLHAALPGTFDPPHEGHFGMAAAFQQSGKASGEDSRGFPTFWVTAEPPHKHPVETAELLRRARALKGYDALFTRGEPLYLDKARKYPGCHFVIGADTLARMWDAKWGPSTDELATEFRKLKTHFFVVPRVVDGQLFHRDVIEHPRDLTSPLEGRWDVSSSQIRAVALELRREHQVVGW